jgi:hypothetical protein
MVLPLVNEVLYFMPLLGMAAQAVMQAALSGHSVLHVAVAIAQKPSHVVPQNAAPPPAGPA